MAGDHGLKRCPVAIQNGLPPFLAPLPPPFQLKGHTQRWRCPEDIQQFAQFGMTYRQSCRQVPFFSLFVAHQRQLGVSDHRQGGVSIPCLPMAYFVVRQPSLAFGFVQ